MVLFNACARTCCLKGTSPTDKDYAPKQCFLFRRQHNQDKQIIHNSKKCL